MYLQPRNLIKAIPGINFQEMQRTKEFSWCCGSGVGIKTYAPKLAVQIAEERLKEADSRLIISACPYCESNLKDAGASVIDLAELYAKLLQSGAATETTSESLKKFILNMTSLLYFAI